MYFDNLFQTCACGSFVASGVTHWVLSRALKSSKELEIGRVFFPKVQYPNTTPWKDLQKVQ
jgi:hypothetical protein